MLDRKSHEKNGKELPDSWIDEVTTTLYEVYQEQCDNTDSIFDIFAETYPDEMILAICYRAQKDLNIIPVTYIISTDLNEKTDSKKMLNSMIDSVGHFFDQVFSAEDWCDYQATWETLDYQGTEFYFKITRENISLSIEANKLLQEK
jgi:hypothetical protein